LRARDANEANIEREWEKMKIEKKLLGKEKKKERWKGKKEEKEGERVRAGMSQNRSGLRGPFPLSMRGVGTITGHTFGILLLIYCDSVSPILLDSNIYYYYTLLLYIGFI
jgi:hypothetical protein